MIVFAPLSTRRLAVRLRELCLEDEMKLCHMPERAHEKALSEFLGFAIESAATPSDRHVADPRSMTVSERLLLLVHYSVHTREDAPDYKVTETARLSDYLDTSREPKQRPTFDACGEKWELQPLTGAMAEAIETLQLETEGDGHKHWLLGLMAAQLTRPEAPADAAAPDAVANPSEYLDWLRARMRTFGALPSSATSELYACFRVALENGTDFFRIYFDDQGLIVLPKEAGAPLSPARFLVHACVSYLALALSGKS